MADPKERLMTPISTGELERRWMAVREVMKEDKLDYLIMRNDESFLGGNVKWFTDLPAQSNYPVTVIFPADDEMTLISHGPAAPAEPGPPPWAARGVKKRISSPYMPSAHYTNNYDAEIAVDVLRESKNATIGLVGKAFIPGYFIEYLTKHLPGLTFIDVTEKIDQIKVIKSPEEIELIIRTARLQDVAMEHVRKSIKPGRRDFEIAAGDQLSVLIETNGPGGLWTELGRCFSIGEPAQELKDASNMALEAQKVSLDMLKPGTDSKDIWDANNAFLVKNGYFPENRLYAHGQGYDFVERPLIRYDEPMKIQTGMNITVHPAATNNTVWASFTDNYIVTESGAGPCIHETPKEIIIV